ncbi:MAG: PAS domain S-box protein [Kosmotoga sp.]|nr:MAG: PAS domain S-box protein [Kosmotoga sp.]
MSMNYCEKFFDFLDEIVFSVDKNLILQSANKSCINLLNTKESEIVGKRCKEVFKSNPEICVECLVKKTLSDKKIHKDRLRCISGEKYMVEILPHSNSSNKDEVLVILKPDKAIKDLRWRLRERIKELETIYKMSNLVESSFDTKEDLINGLVKILPSGWAYPEITEARINFDDKVFKTENFKKTKWTQKEDIYVNGIYRGFIEVVYLKEKPSMDEGPFLKEERKLLYAITERLNRILERLETREELERQRKWLETTLSSIGDAVIVTDTSGTVIFVNHVACELTGYSENEMLGEKVEKVFYIVNEETGEKVENPVDKVLTDKVVVGLGNHTGLISRSGKKYSIADAAAPIKDEGSITGVVMTFRDVTNIRESQQRLKESEKLFRLLAENSKDLIFRYRLIPEPGFEYVSPSAEQITGYTQEDHYKDPQLGFKLVHPDDRYLLKNVAEGEIPEEPIVLRWIKKDGSIIWTELQQTPIYDENGKLIAIEGVSRDITKRKEAEEKLKKSEENLTNLISNIPGVVFKCLNDSNWTMIFLTEGCKELFGYKPEELINNNNLSFSDIIHPDDREYVWNTVQEMKNKGNQYTVEYRIITKNDKTKYVNERGTFTDGNEIIDGVINDVTKMKELQNKIMESEKFYKSIFEDTHELMLIIDPDSTKIVDANKSACNFYGYSRNEMVNMKVSDISTLNENKIKKDLSRIKKAGAGISEAVDILSSGEKRNVLIYFSLIKREGKDFVFSIIHDITELKLYQSKLEKAFEEQHESFINSLNIISNITESRDPYTAGHQRRVSELSKAIAEEMGLDRKTIEGLQLAAMVHDIGKTSLPQEILAKPGKLSNIEFSLIKEHPTIGYNIFKKHNFPWSIDRFIYEHHERINGSGYPRGLKGDEISLESKILAVADVVEAMSSNRPYRPALGIEKALEEIDKNAGILYDEKVSKACLKVFEKGFKFQD